MGALEGSNLLNTLHPFPTAVKSQSSLSKQWYVSMVAEPAIKLSKKTNYTSILKAGKTYLHWLETSRLVYLTSTLVGAPNSYLELYPLQSRDGLRARSKRLRKMRKFLNRTRPGCLRYLVFKLAVAHEPLRLAERIR